MDNFCYGLIVSLIIPCLMTVLGLWFKQKPPKKINHFCGYRTKRSMMNMDTWVFAHKYSGKVCFILGLILILVSVPAVIFMYGKEMLETTLVILSFVQVLSLTAIIFLTEKALKNKFDNNGKPRQ